MYIAQYAPGVLLTRILTLSTSTKHAFQIVRTWAGLSTIGSSWKTYLDIRDSYKEQETSANDFYYELYEAMQGTLLMSAANGGKISFEGTVPPDDDDVKLDRSHWQEGPPQPHLCGLQ